MFWTNWREIEKHNDWGVRGKDDETAALWNGNADGWERRSAEETDFAKRQVAAMNITEDDVVLDVCCGTGPLTIPLAKKAKAVYAMDFNRAMLAYVKNKAEKLGLRNIAYIQGNWNTMEPGVDYPVFDIAVTRHSPAQGNILKLSRCARKYCYSLSNVYAPNALPMKPGERWLKTANEATNRDARPDARFYGPNVQFNLLYESGAHPEIQYVTNTVFLSAETLEALAAKAFPHGLGGEVPAFLRENANMQDGMYTYTREQCMCVMGWDPSEIRYDLLERYGML